MGKTYNQKMQKREDTLSVLPKSERTAKMAQIKKKEGRILNADEKHALQMLATPGKILQAWEIIRASANSSNPDSATEQAKRHKQIDEVLEVIFENFAGYIRTPKVSRVIQSCLKHGTPEHHGKIASKLVGAQLAEFCSDAFAHHVVLALFRHASHQLFDDLYAALLPVASQLGSSKHGFAILCALFSHKYAASQARGDILLSHTLLGSTINSKQTPGYPTFENILAQDTTGTVRVRSRMIISKMVDKLLAGFESATSKNKAAAQHNGAGGNNTNAPGAPPSGSDLEASFAQRLFRAYFTVCTSDEAADAAGSLSQNIVPLLQSKDGVHTACFAFAAVEPTLRRPILRQIAAHFDAAVLSKFGAPFVARVLDFVYDVQLANKFIVPTLAGAIDKVMASPYAHMILLHALTPDEEQKNKALLPVFLDMNLYSRQNANWNKMLFTTGSSSATASAASSTICQQPAEKSHAIFLEGILPAVAKWAKKQKEESDGNAAAAAATAAEETGKKQKQQDFPGKLGLTRVAKELYHLKSVQDPLYTKIAQTQQAAIDTLLEFVPNKLFRTDNENGTAEAKKTASENVAGNRRQREEEPQQQQQQTASPKNSAGELAASKAKQQQQQKQKQQKQQQEDVAIEDEDAPTTKSARRPVNNNNARR